MTKKKHKMFYLETGRGCCLRSGFDEDVVYEKVLREIGEATGITLIREATQADIDWVKGMGGRVPPLLED